MKLNQKNSGLCVANKVGIFSASLIVAAAAVYLYSPVIKTNANTADFEVGTTVSPIAALTVSPAQISFDITPTAAGVFDSDSITATVDTNSVNGYELYFSSVDNDTYMMSDDVTISDIVASDFDGEVTSSTMPVNTWGYSLDDTNYLKIPTLDDHVALRNLNALPTSGEKVTTVYIGTKISSSLSTGVYSKTVKFSAIAHEPPVPHNDLHSITKMQEMTPEICSDTTTPNVGVTRLDWDGSHWGDKTYVPRKVLTDERDGSRYLVSKLADGNCWMSQNLALDLVADTPIEISNNDGTVGTATPNNTTQTTTGTAWANDTNWRSYHPTDDEKYFVGGKTASTTPTENSDEYLWEKTGNFYNWYAATAGSGTPDMIGDVDATSSICPKGWRLPTKIGDKSNWHLFYEVYEMSSSDVESILFTNPINYIKPGNYRYSVGDRVNKGSFTNYWLATATTTASNVQTFRLIGSGASYYFSNAKAYGSQMRCVAI